MFIAELRLYINYLEEQLLHDSKSNSILKNQKYYLDFFKNLRDGISYYRQLPEFAGSGSPDFHQHLLEAEEELDALSF